MFGLRRRRRRGARRKAIRGAAGYTGRLVADGLIQNAGIAIVGAGALKLKSRFAPKTPGFSCGIESAEFKKRGRPKGAKDKQKRQASTILPSKNQAFKITGRDIDKGLDRAETASRAFGNASRGGRNLVSARKDAALAQRYENENSFIDISLRRTSKAVNTVDTARRTAQSIGLIKRRRNNNNPARRVAAGFRLLRMVSKR